MSKKTILIASDHAGFALKEKLKKHLRKRGFIVNDLGTYSSEGCDYPDYTYPLAQRISKGASKRGILICYTGIGSAIVANRLPGVRASLCYNQRAARLTREHNDSNVLVLGAGFVSAQTARKITDTWLKAEFQGGRHRRRLNKIRAIEKKCAGS